MASPIASNTQVTKLDLNTAAQDSIDQINKLITTTIKDKPNTGTDKERRLLFSSHLHALWHIKPGKSDNERYQPPYDTMETLRKDLEATHTPPARFGQAYAISTYAHIAKSAATEDAKEPAVFLFLALAREQYEYVALSLKDGSKTDEDDQGRMIALGLANKELEETLRPLDKECKPVMQLSVLLTAAEGGSRHAQLDKLDDFFPDCEVLAYIFIHSPHFDDAKSRRAASIPMVYMSSMMLLAHHVVFAAGQEQPHVELLARLVVAALQKPGANKAALDFVFLLEAKEAYQAREPVVPISYKTLPGPAPQKMRLLHYRMPAAIHHWATGPMRNAQGELLFPGRPSGPVEGPMVLHPCSVEIEKRHTHHTTLKQVFARFLTDKALLAKVKEVMPGEVSEKVLNPNSKVGSNLVHAPNILKYVCTRVVGHNGVQIDENSDLCFRVF